MSYLKKAELLENLFLIHGVIPFGDLTYNIPSWSISVEFFTYIAFGLIIYKKMQIVFIFTLIIGITMLFFNFVFGLENLIRSFVGFSFGSTTALLCSNLKLKLPVNISIAVVALLIFFLINKPNIKIYDLLIYPISTILIYCLAIQKNGVVNRILKTSCLQFIGLLSYSIYMSHYFILYSLDTFYKKIVLLSDNATRIRNITLIESQVALFTYIILVLVVSSTVYYFIEKPFRDRSRLLVYAKE